MFHVERMAHVELLVLDRDLAALTAALGRHGLCEFIGGPEERNSRHDAEIAGLAALTTRLDQILAAEDLPPTPAGTAPEDTAAARDRLTRFLDRLERLAARATLFENRIAGLDRDLAALVAFSGLDLSFDRLNEMSAARLRYGTIADTALAGLAPATGSPELPGLVLPLPAAADAGQRPLLVFCTPDEEAAVDARLAGLAFHALPLPAATGTSAQALRELARERTRTGKRLARLTGARRAWIRRQLPAATAARRAVGDRLAILRTMRGFARTGETARIRAWLPRRRLGELRELVRVCCVDRAVLEVTDPFALPPDERRALTVPVILRNNRLVRPFEALVRNYGHPVYGEIEPTPLVAFGFVLMFGIMFGDVGQGAILALAGLALAASRRLETSWREAGRLVASVGASAMFFGFVFGSFFCVEGLVPPLWHEPLAAFDNIMALFVATVVFGMLWISVGVVCNIVNRIFFRDWAGALLDKTGLAGLAFYWGTILPPALFLAGVTDGFAPEVLLATSALPLALVLLREPLVEFLRGRAAWPHGFATCLVEALIESIETSTYYVGNTFSFVRVGAFALAHGGLALAVTGLADMVGGGAAGLVIMAGGNLLVIVLEGMVVSIQTLRLEYYEFFSKFYSGNGRAFAPFTLAA